jgi:transketolase
MFDIPISVFQITLTKGLFCGIMVMKCNFSDRPSERQKNFQEDFSMEQTKLAMLTEKARAIRIGAVEAVYSASSGHPGGSLSIADIVAYLYFAEMNVDPADPKKADRDRFVLSKGHTAPALYAALAEKGYFAKENLKTLRQVDSFLQGHPDMKHTPGVDMSSGSLGLGISAAAGMALSAKISGDAYRVYTIVGDGESEEGQVWEAAMFSAHYKLDNLCAFIDWNGLQIDGKVTDVMNPTPLDEKFKAFGWNVIMIDAHDFEQIEAACETARACKGKPTAVICKSVKGKGVSFMENQVGWHGKAPNKEQYETAIAELSASV